MIQIYDRGLYDKGGVNYPSPGDCELLQIISCTCVARRGTTLGVNKNLSTREKKNKIKFIHPLGFGKQQFQDRQTRGFGVCYRAHSPLHSSTITRSCACGCVCTSQRPQHAQQPIWRAQPGMKGGHNEIVLDLEICMLERKVAPNWLPNYHSFSLNVYATNCVAQDRLFQQNRNYFSFTCSQNLL